MLLEELQFNITVEKSTGDACGFALQLGDGGQWLWVGDREFGPFDTTLDVATWITKVMTATLGRTMRYAR